MESTVVQGVRISRDLLTRAGKVAHSRGSSRNAWIVELIRQAVEYEEGRQRPGP